MVLRKRTSFEIFRSVIFALMVRELKTRFGVWRLGYIWAILEPLITISVLTAVITFIRGSSPWFGIPVPVFITTGFLLYLYFTTLSIQSTNSISSNRALFGYRQVKPFDTIVSRAILETTIFLGTTIALVFIGFWFFDFRVIPYDPLRAGLVVSLLILFGFGLSLFFAVFGELHPELAKFIPVINKPLFFLSCVMYPIAMVPPEFQKWLLWNPLLHAIEQFRYSIFPDYPADQTSLIYLLKCTFVSLSFGFLIYTAQRHKLVAT